MFILGIGARANPDTYKSDDYFSQFDEMTKHAKRNPRTNIAFKLQKRRKKATKAALLGVKIVIVVGSLGGICLNCW